MNAVAEVFAFVGRASDVLSQPVGTELGADTPRFMLEQVRACACNRIQFRKAVALSWPCC